MYLIVTVFNQCFYFEINDTVYSCKGHVMIEPELQNHSFSSKKNKNKKAKTIFVLK